MTTVVLNLPFPPSVNNYYAITRNGVYIKAAGKEYRKRVLEEVMISQTNIAIKNRVSIKIMINPPDKRVRDIDNILKCLLDSLEHAEVFVNDSQIDDLHIIRDDIKPPFGKVLVIIDKIENVKMR